MPDTTNFVTQINIDGTICKIKDSVAQTNAASATSTANTAKSTADAALHKATELEKLPRVTVTYSSADTTIKVVTTNTHATA